MNIFIANISREANDDALRALFGEFGTVKSARIITDKLSGYAKGYGFVEMPDEQGAEAIRKLNNVSFHGKSLVVKKAKSPTDITKM